MKKSLIVIPARYGSTRFPGKPLVKIAGKEMLLRVWEIAQFVAKKIANVDAVVATDDERIQSFCEEKKIAYVMTSEACRTGTERVCEVIEKVGDNVDFVMNLQGDNPMCPPWFVEALLNEYQKDSSIEVVTPCVKLSWEELEALRINKMKTPFSGTTAILNHKTNDAIWFSKHIIPAIRKEAKLRETTEKSPVYRHIGLYGYRTDVLETLQKLPESFYEKLEGLEQLRFLENGISVRIVEVDYRGYSGMSGIDAPEDVAKAESLLAEQGEFIKKAAP
ncbi:MAG: 3-deoxy-manno-octulosonate cytidylyltransferase [Pseudomonadota bacterium]|nr:3-deoxy-manno-octulosonate cytidylyltransferase [Gammaproteobacteria bacterium]